VFLSKKEIDDVLGHEVQHLEREKAVISSFLRPWNILGIWVYHPCCQKFDIPF
jgi:hypothetical protein